MSEPEPREFGRIEIVRFIVPGGDLVDRVTAVDPSGEPLPLTEALGMMRLAEDTLIRDRMDRADG